MMSRIVFIVGLFLALTYATPLERKNPQPFAVVDIPADLDTSPSETDTKDTPVASLKEIEEGFGDEVPVVKGDDPKKDDGSSASAEDIEPNRDSNIFNNFRLPTIFIYRRPVIRDPFTSSFGGSLGASSFGRPQFSSFSDDSDSSPSQGNFNVMSHMEKMMQRMQQQMSSIWSSLLGPSFQRPSGHRPFFQPAIDSFESETTLDNNNETNADNFDFGKLPANYSNSTSETKVVDGQLVTVNKTVHKISGNNSSGFFHFSVIKIRPQEANKPKVTTEQIPVAASQPDEVKAPEETKTTAVKDQDPSMNEVDGSGNKEEVVESFPYLLNRFDTHGAESSPESERLTAANEQIDFVPMKGSTKQKKAIDLSGDLKVNQLMDAKMRSGAFRLIDPDVEFINVN